MTFNDHSKLSGLHAPLSASQYHWLNYDEDKLITVYKNKLAVQRGTELHELAARLIKQKVKLPRSKKTLNSYVNDAIGYRMIPEQILYFSQNCFGTADAIKFSDNLLRIHDLKTGATPASIKQLYIYASLFCLEYDIKPKDIKFELRIYQSDDILIDRPTTTDITPIIDKIIRFDNLLNSIKEEEGISPWNNI